MNKQPLQEEIITTKDLILKFINVANLISSKWRFILTAAGIGALSSLMFDAKNFKKPMYLANTTFNLESGSAGGGGEMASLASAFGLGGMSASRPADLFSGENFWQILETRLVIEKALMTEVTIKGKKQLMANYYIEKSGIIEDEWAGTLFDKPNTAFIKYRFKKKDPANFTNFENELMSELYAKLNKQTETGQVGTSSLAFITLYTQNEMLSKVFAETLLLTIYEFYKELKTKKTQLMLNISERRADSLKAVLYQTEQNLATYTNQNLGIVIAEGQMQQTRLARNTGQLANLYAQTQLQVDQLKTILVNQTPLYTIIEPIRLPLARTDSGYGGNLKLGAIFGIFLSIIFLIARKAVESVISQI